MTPAEISARLDAFGKPRHLEARREVSMNECRAFLRHDAMSRARIDSVARAMGLHHTVVRAVWMRMIRPV